MKIETQLLEDHQAKLTVEIDESQMEEAKRRAARKLAARIKIPGFRPGKAPYQVIVRQIGDAALVEEALELLVKETYPKILEEAEIHPYGPGELEKVVSLTPPVLEFLVPRQAEVILGDYQVMRRPYEMPQVKDEEVKAVLQNLRERQALIEPVERHAQQGDLVTVHLSASRKSVAEGEEPILIRERSVPLIVQPEEGSTEEANVERDDQWPFPGFSSALIGLSVGDEKTLPYTYPEDSGYEALRGVEAEFHFVVESVKARTLPELDDEFATSVGEYENLEALRAGVLTMLKSQAESSYNEDYDEAILKEAGQQATIKYPPQMLKRELDDVIENLTNRLKQQNLDLDLYLKSRQIDLETLREEMKPIAESRLKRSLVLLELAKAERIQVTEDELQNEAMNTVSMLTNSLPKKDARLLSDQNVYRNLVGNVMADMLSHRAMERLRNICSGKLYAASEAVSQLSPQETGPTDAVAAPSLKPESEAVSQPELKPSAEESTS